jgi:serine protease Do
MGICMHAGWLHIGEVLKQRIQNEGRFIGSAGDEPTKQRNVVVRDHIRYGKTGGIAYRHVPAGLTEGKVETEASRTNLGLSLQPLSPSERAANDVQEGLFVENVSGASARTGILPGDVLLAVNGLTLKSVALLNAVLAKKPDSVALLILRRGERIFVPVELR